MTPETLHRLFDVVADAPGGVQRLRELILQLAVRGKLVPQDPNDEPASVLLDTIEEEKRRLYNEGKIRKLEKLPPVEPDEVPFEVPEGWVWVRMGQLITLISGQHLPPGEYHQNSDGIPYLTGPADFGKISPVATRWTHTRKAVAERGDILLTVKGAGIGKVNVLAYPEAAISRQLMAIRPIYVSRKFVLLLVRAAWDRLQEEKVGIAIPGISREDVLRLPIALPPLQQQHRIVAKVDRLMVLCDELEERLSNSRALAESIAAAVVNKLTAT